MHLLYPDFLWGMLTLVLPVAIHLLQLRRPQRVLFTNTGFIREIELTTTRRRQLQEIVVLLMRLLAVAFLVLLFCQPYLPVAHTQAVVGNEPVEVVLDSSGSMQALGQAQELGQEAKNQAQLIGRSYDASTRYHLVGRGVASLTKQAYLQMVTDAVPATRRMGWGEIAARDALQSSAPKGSLYVFSDFQKSEAKTALLQDLSNTRQVVLLPLKARPTGNVYVDSVWLNDAFVRVRANMTMHVRLRNGGGVAIANCPVKVLVAERQVAAFQISLESGQAKEVTTQIQLPDASLVQGQVVVQDAPVTFDNTYYFTLQPATVVNVLEIANEPLTRAVYASEPLFTYAFAKPQTVDYSVLQRVNLVLVREVEQLDAGLRQALAEVVRRGGSVVVVPAASVTARSAYQELFQTLGIENEQWETATATTARQEVAMPNLQNPFFKDVFGAQPPRVALSQVVPVLRVGQGGSAIMRLRDGDGFLTEFDSGIGRTYVFAAPFAKAYSDFAAHALFVPVLYRLAMLSYHSDQLPAYRLNTPTLALTVPAATRRATAEAASYRLVHDSLAYIPVQRMQGQQLRLDVPQGMSTPGFYKLEQQGKVIATLAFNAPRRESELAAYSAAELRQLVGPNRPNVQVLDSGSQPEALARYRAEQASRPLWRYCLLVVLGCLLAEALLLRFGRPRSSRLAVA